MRNPEDERRVGELEDARADDRADDDSEEPAFDPTTGGPGLAGLTPPD